MRSKQNFVNFAVGKKSKDGYTDNMDWSNICKVMRYADCRNETAYQGFIKEMILEEKLGWNPSQITEQLSLQLGSTERLVPDLVVSKDDRNSFIVEVKKLGHKKTHGDIEQLLSYMKQLETPVGIYWGDEVEVYYKTIGDGSAPVLLMCLNFNVLCEDGDIFISLFSENTYCVEEVCKFKDERESKKAFDSKVNELLSEVSSLEFQEELRSFIAGHLQKRGASKDIETEVMGKISVSVTVDSGDEEYQVVAGDNQVSLEEVPYINVGRRGVVQRYAYNIIRQIIEKNPGLNFEQMYAVFRRKNRIEKVSLIEDRKRWFMAEEDLITLSDGTKIAISNQWGLNGASKPNMDNLSEVAKRFGIDTSLPVENYV